MLRRVAIRMATGALTLLLVTLLVFGLIQLAPGSPLATSDDGLTPLSSADREALEAYYGFDQPLGVQYASWLGKLARGDLGTSIRDRRPVLDKIAERLPVTLCHHDAHRRNLGSMFVAAEDRTIAYDWYDCHKELPYLMYWAAGCVDEAAAAQ